jgi:hypothetical protein
MRYHVRVWFQLKIAHFMFSDFAAQPGKVGLYELDGSPNQPINRCILGSFFCAVPSAPFALSKAN